MFADRQQKVQAKGLLSRSGPALAVVGIHVLLIYLISASMGVVPIPSFKPPMDAVFIEEKPYEPEPTPVVEPEIEPPTQTVMPTVPEPVVLPIETEVVVPPSDTAPTAREVSPQPPAAASFQELQTRQRIDPTYPPASRRAGEEGTVRLRVLVDERGRPSDVQVAQGSGFSRLDDAAVAAVRRWRFEAARNGGSAVSAWTQVSVTFKLTNQ
jgi:periplasmic protein TonB